MQRITWSEDNLLALHSSREIRNPKGSFERASDGGDGDGGDGDGDSAGANGGAGVGDGTTREQDTNLTASPGSAFDTVVVNSHRGEVEGDGASLSDAHLGEGRVGSGGERGRLGEVELGGSKRGYGGTGNLREHDQRSASGDDLSGLESSWNDLNSEFDTSNNSLSSTGRRRERAHRRRTKSRYMRGADGLSVRFGCSIPVGVIYNHELCARFETWILMYLNAAT